MKLTLFILLFISAGALAQTSNEATTREVVAKELQNLAKSKKVWMLTYFRQRYPTRIEKDAHGNTVEVLLEQKGTYYLFHKEEEFGVNTGERRAIRVATAKDLLGPYQIIEGPLNKGQIVPVITGGPTVIRDPIKQGWLLYYDYPMTNGFGASYSPDLMNWIVEKNVRFPADARHGCVSLITPEEARTLIDSYSGKQSD